MKKAIVFLLGLCWLFSCGGEDSKQTAEEGAKQQEAVASGESLESAAEVQEEAYDHSVDFYSGYDGKLGKYPISMQLIKVNDKLSGFYLYERTGQPIELQASALTPEGIFKMNEFDPDTRAVTGIWTGRVFPNRIEGVWQSKDGKKKLDIQLQRRESGANAKRLDLAVFHEETVRYLIEKDTASPHYTQIHTVLFPASDYSKPNVASMYKGFEEFFGEYAVEGNPIKSLEVLQTANLKNFRESVAEIYADPEFKGSPGLDWSSISAMEIVYNERGVLSYAWDYYDYTGGAHGNYGRTYQAYDISTGKRLKMASILKKGKEGAFRDKIVEAVKLSAGLGPKEQLADKGYYEEDIQASDSFYITHKGIGFFFSPYEIAPYAVGATEIFIPFSEIEELLQIDAGWYQGLQAVQ